MFENIIVYLFFSIKHSLLIVEIRQRMIQHARIKEFSSVGVQPQLTENRSENVFLVLNLFYRWGPKVYFKGKLILNQGVQHLTGGSTFSRVGGFNC